MSTKTKDLVALSDLRVWEDNYNIGDVGAIARSIERFGYNGVVRVWRDNLVLGGNHSVLALRSLKQRGRRNEALPWPPTHVVEEGGEWYVQPSSLEHLSEKEAIAFAIADNRTARLGYHDDEVVAEYLVELAEEGDDDLLLATGYDHDDLDFLLHGLDFDLPDLSARPDIPRGLSHEVKVTIGNSTKLEEVVSALHDLVEQHEEWDASVAL